MPSDLRDLLPDSVFSSDLSSLASSASTLGSFSYLLSFFLDAVGLSIGSLTRTLLVTVGMLVLSSVASRFSSFSGEGAGRAYSFLLALTVLSVLAAETTESIAAVTQYFQRLNALTSGILPVMGTLYAMGGNITSATVTSSGLSIYLVILEEVVGKTVLPFAGVVMALTFVCAFDPQIRVGTLLSNLKKHYTTLLSFLMVLLLAMLATQTTLSSRADSVALRGVKFAAGNLIPVVGGSVSELLRTVGDGISYLRTTLGTCALLLTLLALFPPVIRLLLSYFLWQISASVADLLGCETEKKFLDGTASLCGYLLACACICASVLFLSVTLLTHSACAVSA